MTGSSRVEDLLRELAPQVLCIVARRCGDFEAAEDAVQEALIEAAARWHDGDGHRADNSTQHRGRDVPGRGEVPGNPRAWLVRVASRKLIDAYRSDRARRHREHRAAQELAALRAGPAGAYELSAEPEGAAGERDDTLTLLFLCCHPSLSPASAIALTLRAVGGLTTSEIANAYLVPEATMAQRISRAKQTIKASGVPFGMPAPDDRDERLRSVRQVLYLMFNEGYAVSGGPTLYRTDLSGEAIRLTRMAHRALPEDRETAGMLALMLLTDARRPARLSPGGDLVPLAEQDRGRWDRGLIAEGTALIDRVIGGKTRGPNGRSPDGGTANHRGSVGEYQVQAAIAALHDRAPSVERTDWPQINALYTLLESMTGNPVVTLNRAIAVAMVDGPAAGLRLLDGLDARLPGSHRLDAVRAHLHELAGNHGAALAHYRAAAARTSSLAERRYLTMRAAHLNAARPA